MNAPLPPDLAAALLRAATDLAGSADFRDLAARLRPALAAFPGTLRGTLGIQDEERGVYTSYIFAPSARTATPGETAQDASAATSRANETARAGELNRPAARAADVAVFEDFISETGPIALKAAPHALVSPDLTRIARSAFQQRLLDAGVRRYVSVPLVLRDRLLGNLLVGFHDSADPPAAAVPFVEQLAQLVAPVLWNCHSDVRFKHGDARRDILMELSDAINRTLDPATVLDAARRAIRHLAGHRYSSIQLLDDDGRTCQSYRHYPEGHTPRDLADPQTEPVAGSVLAWISANDRSYESDDLARRVEFEHDYWLRDLGVRRYVATPLFARGRIIGCFLIGTADPHRALRVDVWLYENIALQLALAIDNARQLAQVRDLSDRLAQENVYYREEIQREHDFGEMVGRSPALDRVRAAITRVARTDSTVLIMGETGVGKELVARAIHAASPRAAEPMVKVNCAAIPEGMVESELFGHERGAFTSAVDRRIGRFELASTGTLFLDEVGELPLAVQAKLLRVLQDGQFERVGGSETLTSNTRILAATNRNLLKRVQDGAFRSDLYYRLAVFPLDIPPLRERREDIPRLVEAFVAQFSRRMGKRITSIETETLAALQARHWPGNIRELRHVIERALILCDGEVFRVTEAAPPEPAGVATTAAAEPARVVTLREAEAEHIRRALAATAGVVEGPRGAAKLLGIKPSTLRFRMRRLGVDRPGRDNRE